MSEFRFKEFAVNQEGAAMKVGTDGVLIGAWTQLNGSEKRILDVGTGTGLIALMMAQRSGADTIIGVEIDAMSARCASRNFASSPWNERLKVENIRIQDYSDSGFDLIIANPPYFESSLLPPKKDRAVARHASELTIRELARNAERLLLPSARMAVILPAQQFEEFAGVTRLGLRRRCNVHTVPSGPVRRVMGEFVKDGDGECLVSELTIETSIRGEFSERYRELTRDFYLKF